MLGLLSDLNLSSLFNVKTILALLLVGCSGLIWWLDSENVALTQTNKVLVSDMAVLQQSNDANLLLIDELEQQLVQQEQIALAHQAKKAVITAAHQSTERAVVTLIEESSDEVVVDWADEFMPGDAVCLLKYGASGCNTNQVSEGVTSGGS